MNIDVIIQLLNLFIAGSAGVERFVALRNQLEAMKSEGRDPTDAEWEELINGIATDSAALEYNASKG